MCVEIIEDKGWGKPPRGLLHLGTSRSIVFKKSVSNRQLKKLGPKDHVTYSTYGCSVVSKSTALVSLRLVKFSNSKIFDYELRVDEVNSAKD